jgi:hypothetical protein
MKLIALAARIIGLASVFLAISINMCLARPTQTMIGLLDVVSFCLYLGTVLWSSDHKPHPRLTSLPGHNRFVSK